MGATGREPPGAGPGPMSDRRQGDRRRSAADAGAGAPAGAPDRRYGERRGAVARAAGDAPGGLLDSIVDGETFMELAAEGAYKQSYGGDEEGERAECLAFRVGDEEYALEIGHLREIIFPPPITLVPRAPANVVGVLALRGSMVTVVDLRQRLGFPDVPLTLRSRILVVHHDHELFGLVVDGVSEVVRFVPTAVEPPPPTHRRLEMDVVKGVLHREGRLLIMLDLERVLSFGAQPGGRAQEDR